MAARGPAMNFPRGLSIQACYVVMEPVQKTVGLHQHWSAANHPDLKVYLHGNLSGKPTPDDFKLMASAPDNGPVKALAEATRGLATEKSQLQMTRSEAAQFAKADSGTHGKGFSGPVGQFWANLLCQRANDFLAGGLARQPAYELGGETVRVANDAGQMLKELPKIRSQFSELANSVTESPSHPQLYWELSNVEGQAALSLGSIQARQAGANWQLSDTTYYASSGYFVLLTFYQMWPVKIDGQDATLVWRGDLLSAGSLGELHGVERVGASTSMMKEIKKTIGIFLKDVSTKH